MDIGGSNPLKGDMLVIGGSMLYAIANVSEVYAMFLLTSFLKLRKSQVFTL